jgi:cyclopropane fatty-acyl-phospholipid synthase-like methyltransferase
MKIVNGFNMIHPATNHDYFSREMSRANIPAGARILEIGFGNGEFMQWARVNGYAVSGVEVNEKLCQLARGRNFDVFLGQITDDIDDLGGEFDALVGFDVCEHLPGNLLVDYFRAMSRLLKSGGRVLVRFPNGQSPFGRYYQYNDLTHQSVLTGRLIGQIAEQTGLSLEGCYNAVRIYGKKKRLKKVIKYWLRDLLELALGNLHFGERIPMDANLTCVLVKEPDARD